MNRGAFLTLRVVLGFVGVIVLVNLVLGFAIFTIAFGIFYAFLLLATTFDHPYRLAVAISHLKGLPLHLRERPIWWRIFCCCVLLPAQALLVVAGVRMLELTGFCAQNPLCVFGRVALGFTR